MKELTDSEEAVFEKLSNGEYLEVTYKSKTVAEFEYLKDKGVFLGVDYTENFYSNDSYIDDLQDGYRIDELFTPRSLFDMLNEWKNEFPEMVIIGKTLLEKRIDEGTI